MTRLYDQNGSTKSIAATTVQTITYTASDIPGDGVVAYHIAMSAAGNTLADITSIVLKAGGSPIYSLSAAQLINFTEATSPANYASGTAAQRITIPLYDLRERIEEVADTQQFPRGQLPTLEVNLGSGSASGSMVCSWTRTTVAPVYYPRLLSIAHGFPVAAGYNLRMPFNTPMRPGAGFQGFSFPSAGLSRLKCVVSGVQLMNVFGAAWAASSGSPLQELQANTQANSVADPAWSLWRGVGPAVQGDSYIEVDLDGTQAAGGQVCIYDRIPQVAGQ